MGQYYDGTITEIWFTANSQGECHSRRRQADEKNTQVEQALMKELRELKAEVAAVKERVHTLPQAQNPPTQQPETNSAV